MAPAGARNCLLPAYVRLLRGLVSKRGVFGRDDEAFGRCAAYVRFLRGFLPLDGLETDLVGGRAFAAYVRFLIRSRTMGLISSGHIAATYARVN